MCVACVEKTKRSRHEYEAKRTPPGNLLSSGIQTEGSLSVHIKRFFKGYTALIISICSNY